MVVVFFGHLYIDVKNRRRDRDEPADHPGSEGEQRAWEQLLDKYRDRLNRLVTLRLDRRLRGRVDASDVIQEASLEAVRRLPEYLKNPSMPFFL